VEKSKVLIADDEGRIRKLVRDFLVKEGYDVYEAADGMETIKYFQDIDDLKLIILDVMMPGTDGFAVLKRIRATSNIPVIMLTAKTSEEDELRGFELGVDEYVQKPFSPKLLMARVNAVIRRSDDKNMVDSTSQIITAGGITIDVGAHVVKCDDQEIVLSVKEFELLSYFVNNEGIALSRDMILNNVWNYDFFGDARTIDTHVKKLRNKLGVYGKYIKTIWGMGYKFETVSE
jgi:DNA-binding response OmpR family regulator